MSENFPEECVHASSNILDPAGCHSQPFVMHASIPTLRCKCGPEAHGRLAAFWLPRTAYCFSKSSLAPVIFNKGPRCKIYIWQVRTKNCLHSLIPTLQELRKYMACRFNDVFRRLVHVLLNRLESSSIRCCEMRLYRCRCTPHYCPFIK